LYHLLHIKGTSAYQEMFINMAVLYKGKILLQKKISSEKGIKNALKFKNLPNLLINRAYM